MTNKNIHSYLAALILAAVILPKTSFAEKDPSTAAKQALIDADQAKAQAEQAKKSAEEALGIDSADSKAALKHEIEAEEDSRAAEEDPDKEGEDDEGAED